MKLNYFALTMAVMMAVALTGCSAGRETNSTAPIMPTNSVSADDNARPSAGMDDNARPSTGMDDNAHPSTGMDDNTGMDKNDAAQGGGAGGTNDRNNDGKPDSGTGNIVDDIGDAAGDVARGAGDVVRDAGDAIGNAVNDASRSMR